MPITIEADPIHELVQFHGQIRAMFKQMETLGELDEAKRENEISSIVTFLNDAILWHDIDEELSVFSRLRNMKLPNRVDTLLKECSSAHEEMEEKIAEIEIFKVLENALADPRALGRAGKELARILEPHLVMEEQELFPLARLLFDRADLEKIRAEMDQRKLKRIGGLKTVIALD